MYKSGVAREVAIEEKLKVELNSAIAKLPDCDKKDLRRALVSFVNEVLTGVDNKAAASSKDGKVEEQTALKDRLKLTLVMEDLLKRYSKEVIMLAVSSIINNMVKNESNDTARNGNDGALRK